MNFNNKNRVASIALLLLGITILVIGVLGPLAPPIITGIGFLLLSWALW